MQKKLEADLISIAHRILQLKNKSDINQLYLETQKLYEKLAVLRFVEEHFGEPKPTIGQAEVVEKMKEFFENIAVPEFQMPATVIKDKTPADEIIDEEVKEEESEIEPETVLAVKELPESIIAEPLAVEEEAENTIAEELEAETPIEEPLFVLEETENSITEELESETPIEEPLFVLEETEIEPVAEPIEPAKPEEAPKKKEAVQISFDDLLGGKYTDPDFVKVSSSSKKQESEVIKTEPSFQLESEPILSAPQTSFEREEPKSITLNDKLVKEISIGLNDRIAFVKHLFGGSNEDYNRVLNQLITFDTFLETKAFIDELVKPDYNNWEGKEDYEHRFMEIIEKKFLSF